MTSAPGILPISRVALSEGAALELCSAIIRGDLCAGAKLREEELASRLGVSRTPVREALRQVAGAGLIELAQNRGGTVLPFGERELREVYHVRATIEAEAVRLACAAIGEERIAGLQASQNALAGRARRDARWSDEAIKADAAFHELLAAESCNRRLALEVDRYRWLVAAVRQALGGDRDAQAAAVQQHLNVLNRLAHRDASGAAEAMRRHIQSAADCAVELLIRRRK